MFEDANIIIDTGGVDTFYPKVVDITARPSYFKIDVEHLLTPWGMLHIIFVFNDGNQTCHLVTTDKVTVKAAWSWDGEGTLYIMTDYDNPVPTSNN